MKSDTIQIDRCSYLLLFETISNIKQIVDILCEYHIDNAIATSTDQDSLNANVGHILPGIDYIFYAKTIDW